MFIESSETSTIGTVKTYMFSDRYLNPGLKMFHAINHGAATMTHGVLEWSNDGRTWGTLSAAFNLDVNGEFWFTVNDGRPYFRLGGAVASGSSCKVTWKIYRT